jgi:hypothetical protein
MGSKGADVSRETEKTPSFETFHVKRAERSLKKYGYGIAARSEAFSSFESGALAQRPSFPDTEFPKDDVEDFLDINSSSESAETCQSMAQILRHELLARALLRFRHGIAHGV